MQTIWTAQDEKRLQREIEVRALWLRVLDRSTNETTLRSGYQGRAQCRDLICRADKAIAVLLARKEAPKETA